MDIGYNAVRAVVYENNKLGAPEIFNNKFKSDLLSLLANDSFDIKHQTYLSIRYLLHIFKRLGVTDIHCVATAVLREHPKANDFISYIKNKYNFEIKVLSGEEEARLTALGLISGIAGCSGIAADLGGGSLELVEVNDRRIGKLGSLKLGTQIITSSNITDSNEITDIIVKEFGSQKYPNLYLIGGALRFISRLYIDFIRNPIKNLHNFEIPADDFSNYLSKIKISSIEAKNKIGKRKISLNAVLVAEAMIRVFRPEKIIISTFGIKEGVRASLFSAEYSTQNIIEEKVAYACNYDLSKTNFTGYYDILKLIIPETANLYNLLKLSIILYSLKSKFDRTLPPKAIYEYILASEIPFSTKIRVMLALISVHASSYKPDHDLIKHTKKLLTKQEYASCQIIGYFLLIAEEIDGSVFSEPSFSIKVKNFYYEIEWNEILPRPIFEKICVRLKSIAYVKKIYFN